MESLRVRGCHWYTYLGRPYPGPRREFAVRSGTVTYSRGRVQVRLTSYTDVYRRRRVTGNCTLRSIDQQGIQLEGKWQDPGGRGHAYMHYTRTGDVHVLTGTWDWPLRHPTTCGTWTVVLRAE